MSHVDKLEMRFEDEECMLSTAEALGMVKLEKNTYRWYGRHVGDHPLPEGFTAEDLGRCEYAFALKDNPRAYEVGVVRAKDGKGFELLFDFWQGGYGLMDVIGRNKANKFVTEYNLQRAEKEQRRRGRRTRRERNTETGWIEVVAEVRR